MGFAGMDDYSQKSDSSMFVPLREVLPAVVDNVIKAAESEAHIPGESTGFPCIDRKILGLNPSHLIALASPPQMGKTSLALNIAVNVAKQSRKAVAVFSPDMLEKDVATRLLSAEARVKRELFSTGELEDSDWEKIAQSCADLTNTGIHVDDSRRLTVAGICAKCRKIENLGLVVVDNLQSIVSADEQVHPEDSSYQLSPAPAVRRGFLRAVRCCFYCASGIPAKDVVGGDSKHIRKQTKFGRRHRRTLDIFAVGIERHADFLGKFCPHDSGSCAFRFKIRPHGYRLLLKLRISKCAHILH